MFGSFSQALAIIDARIIDLEERLKTASEKDRFEVHVRLHEAWILKGSIIDANSLEIAQFESLYAPIN